MKMIFATDLSGGLGLKGALPWGRIPEDLAFFKKVTKGAYVVVGHKTLETLPLLPGRVPVLFSDRPSNYAPKVSSLEELAQLEDSYIGDVFIIGGSSLITKDFMAKCTEIYHTTILGTWDSDVSINKEVLEYLETYKSELVLKTSKVLIRKYINEEL